LSFNGGKLTLGRNTIKITDYQSANYGKNLIVTEGAIPGYTTKKNPISVTVKWDDNPIKSIKFENQKQWAYIKIVKTWDLLPGTVAPGAKFKILDAAGKPIHKDVGPGTYKVKEGTYTVEENEIPGFTAYENPQTITVKAGETETVTFKNKEDRGKLIIIKKWQDGDGNPMEAPDGITPLFDVCDSNNVRVLEGVPEGTYTVAPGTYTIIEDPVPIGYLDSYDYDPAKSYDHNTDTFKIAADETVTVIVTNRPPPPIRSIFDKIPSKTHVDRWWDNYGILAYGASSMQDKDTYGFAFSLDFWEKNNSVTIGFGTKDDWTYIVTIKLEGRYKINMYLENGVYYRSNEGRIGMGTWELVYDPDDTNEYVTINGNDYRLVCYENFSPIESAYFVFRDSDEYKSPVLFDSHYGGRGKNASYDISIGAKIDNPFQAGKMQLWLLSIEPKE